jgi:hypothetical protein
LDVVALVLRPALPLKLADICDGDSYVTCWLYVIELLNFSILLCWITFCVPLQERPQSTCREENIYCRSDVSPDGLILVEELMRKNRVKEALLLIYQVRLRLNDFKVQNMS